MKQYIGIKMVQAEPCEAWKDAGNHKVGDPGYKVVYPDGYVSWSPKDVFEKAYLPVETNPMLRTDKPSISQQMVEDFIVDYEVQTMGDKCTVVRATLRNGFEIVESSACVSKENYDEALGARICMKKVEDKVWFLLGFLLQTGVHGLDWGESSADKADDAEEACMDFGAAIRAVKQGKKIARKGWNGKGQYVFMARDIEFVTDADISAFDGKDVEVHDLLVIKTAQDVFQPGWLASQSDMLAEDWYIVK